MGRLILSKFVGLIALLFVTAGSVCANEPASKSSDVASQVTSSDGASTSSEWILPINEVEPLPVGPAWRERFEAVGIPLDTLLVGERSTHTEEQKRDLMAQRHYFMGWYFLELNQPGRAIEEFDSALEYDPENSHILLDMARAHLTVRELEEAEKVISQVLDKETTNVVALRLRAEADFIASESATGDEKESLLDRSVENYEKAREIQPKNLEVLRGLAKAYIQKQDVAKVISVYKDIVEVDPRDTYSLLILAQVLSRMDRLEEAVPYYQRVIEQRRSFVGGYVYLAQIYERLRRFDDAMDLYKQALLVDASNVELLRRFDSLLQQMHGSNNTALVLRAYEDFVGEYPGNTEIRRIYAEKLISEEEFDKAAEQYERILEIDPENSQAYISVSKIYGEQKDYARAVEFLRKAAEVNPDQIDLYDAMASMLLMDKNSTAAIEVYRDAISFNPMADKLYISMAALLENDDRTSEAIEVMEQAIEKTGDKPELLAVLGKFYRSEGMTVKAQEILERAYELESGNLPLFGELMTLYIAEGRTSDAEAITTRTAEEASQGKDVVYSIAGEFYVNAGETTRAIELNLMALQESPTKPEYLGRMVELMARNKQFEAAHEALDTYGGRMRDQNRVEMLRSQLFAESGDHDRAVAIWQKIIKDNPLNLQSYQIYIDLLNDAKRFDESVRVLKEAQEKFGDAEPEALAMTAGMVYYRQKNYDEAEKAFKGLVELTEEKSDDAFYYLGSVYLDQERFDEAEAAFRKAIEINPVSANALNALGYMFADRNIKLDEARDLIEQALVLSPDAAHILDSMGWVLYREGDLEGAEEYITRAAAKYDDPEIHLHLGKIYAKKGDTAKARESFEHVLELDPENKAAKEQLDKLLGSGQ